MKKAVVWLGAAALTLSVLAVLAIPARADNPAGFTELYYAMQNDDPVQLKTSLKKNAKYVNLNDGELLHGAVGMLRRPEMIQMLLVAGANPNLREKNTGNNTLHTVLAACNSGTSKRVLAIVKLLVARGADVNAQETTMGYTPLHVAARKEAVGKEIFAALLAAKNVNPNIRCKATNESQDGAWPALFYVISRPSDPTRSNKDIVQMLVAKKADVNATTTDQAAAEKQGWTTMHFVAAATEDRADIAAVLLAAGAPLDKPSLDHAMTPLHLTLWHDNPRICELLLEKGADLHTKNSDGVDLVEHARGWGTDKHTKAAVVILKWAETHK